MTVPFVRTPGDRFGFVLGHPQDLFSEWIPGGAGQPHRTFEPGGHFLRRTAVQLSCKQCSIGWHHRRKETDVVSEP